MSETPRYRVEFTRSARKAFAGLPVSVQQRLDPHILALAKNPRPSGVAKLAGEEDAWRIRVGDYRIVYEIHDDVLLVLVVRVGHRREIYRKR